MATDLRAELVEQGLYEMLRLRLQRTVVVPNPAVGADWSQVVPGGVIWELLSLDVIFATSAVVATRVPALYVRDSDNRALYHLSMPASLAASGAAEWTLAVGLGVTTSTTAQAAPLPSPAIVLQPGSIVRVTTTALDAGDQWSNIFMTVREWSPQQAAAQAGWISRQLATTYTSDEGGA